MVALNEPLRRGCPGLVSEPAGINPALAGDEGIINLAQTLI